MIELLFSDFSWLERVNCPLIRLFNFLLLLLLHLNNILIFLEFSFHMNDLFILGEQLFIHIIHGDFIILDLGLESIDLAVIALDLYPLLVELALVFSHPDLAVLLFLPYHIVYLALSFLQLLDR